VKRDGHAVVAAPAYNLSLFPTATSATKRLSRHLLQVIEYQLPLGSYYAAMFRWAPAPCRFHETLGRPNDLWLRLAHRRYSDRIYGDSSPPRYAIPARDTCRRLRSPLDACGDQLVRPWTSLRPSEQIVSTLHVQTRKNRSHQSDDTFAALIHDVQWYDFRLAFASGLHYFCPSDVLVDW